MNKMIYITNIRVGKGDPTVYDEPDFVPDHVYENGLKEIPIRYGEICHSTELVIRVESLDDLFEFFESVLSRYSNVRIERHKDGYRVSHGEYLDDFHRKYANSIREIPQRSEERRSYRPSNGAEGDIFMSKWCGHCKHDHNEDCQIIAMTMGLCITDENYPKEWVYDENDKPLCTKFENVIR